MKISEAQAAVADFHRHVKVCERAPFQPITEPYPIMLQESALILQELSQQLEVHVDNPHILRAHLMIEELGEHLLAVAHGNEIEAVDGLADLLYVLLGTSAVFGWPLEAAFIEVHRSNMTKEKQPDDPSAARVRSKGPNYQPPNIEGILACQTTSRQ
jgi:predicted HAD superfamily Cof-like phosphohydrolase